MHNAPHSKTFTKRLKNRVARSWKYMSSGVWCDTRTVWRVRFVKTVNLTVRSFLNSDLQSQACALTYRTLLAIVPVLALLFAIGRGFGFQNTITDQLYSYFPSQRNALDAAISFVDSYLAQSSEGIFVGVGIVFLLWTLISLLSSVENSFNIIWQVSEGRTFQRKVTDYLAIFLILPVIMICASGLSLLMSTTIRSLLPIDYFRPTISIIIDCVSYALTWLFFTGAYMLIPNAKVKFRNALIAGIFVGTGFQILQWLFLSGQMYVSKYNAIYGSFSFLPLLLIWLQLVWLITLIGGLLCYASQNIGQFDFGDNVKNISADYRVKVMIAITAIICKRFMQNKRALTISEIALHYGIPVNLTAEIVHNLKDAGLVNFIETSSDNKEHPVQPATDISTLTVNDVIRRMQIMGDNNFIPKFDIRYKSVIDITERVTKAITLQTEDTTIISLNITI